MINAISLPRRLRRRIAQAFGGHVRRWRRGQSLVELAMVLPVLLLLVVGAIDLGRAYFGAINLENAVKEGAFYGARRPICGDDTPAECADPGNVEARVEIELDGTAPSSFEAKCFDPGTTVFTGTGMPLADCEDGDIYYVRAQIPFNLITPLMSNIVGSSLTLTSDASAVVITSFEMLGGEVTFPSDAPTPTPPSGSCTVPDFSLGPTKLGDAVDVWVVEAAFLSSNITVIGPPGQNATWQSLPAGTVGPCNSTSIIVSNSPQTTPTPTPTASPTPTPVVGASPTPTPTPVVGGTPTPTPVANCTVPRLTGLRVTVAQARWVVFGFTAANFSANRPPNSDYDVGSQSLAEGSVRPCLTTAVVVGH